MPRQTVDRLLHERSWLEQGATRIAGVDEAGRGPLAGPVVAAAVMFPPEWLRGGFPERLRALNDSKQLSETRRVEFFALLTQDPAVRFGIAVVGVDVIDRINILRATHQAMNESLAQLPDAPQRVLVDGRPVPSLRLPQSALVKGDTLSYSIAAASVLAKVTRDRIMTDADRTWPQFGFARHKGYPTPDHLEALRRHGPCPWHRRSFAPVQQVQMDLFS